MGPENVVKTTVFLADMADFPKMNEVYARTWGRSRRRAPTDRRRPACPRRHGRDRRHRGVLIWEVAGLSPARCAGVNPAPLAAAAARPSGSCGDFGGGVRLRDLARAQAAGADLDAACWTPLPTTARTRWRLGLKRRWVTLWAWLTRLPNCGPLPQTSHR